MYKGRLVLHLGKRRLSNLEAVQETSGPCMLVYVLVYYLAHSAAV